MISSSGTGLPARGQAAFVYAVSVPRGWVRANHVNGGNRRPGMGWPTRWTEVVLLALSAVNDGRRGLFEG